MTVRHTFRRPLPVLALSVLLALGAAACGDDDDETTTGSESGSGSGESSGGGEGDMSIEIVSPADGDDVEAPFDVELDSNIEIGEPDTGLHHFHLYYDGNTSDGEYDLVYEEGSFTIERDLGEGEHTVRAVIANADHSLTDTEQEITLNVAGGSGGGSDTTSDDPYDY